MVLSDSEGFESADEGFPATSKKKDKEIEDKPVKYNVTPKTYHGKRTNDDISSINESSPIVNREIVQSQDDSMNENKDGWDDDGWDDFNADESQSSKEVKRESSPVKNIQQNVESQKCTQEQPSNNEEGWDDFDDWGDNKDDQVITSEKTQGEPNEIKKEHSEKEYKELADRLSALGEGGNNANTGSGWGGWGSWGVTNFLTTGVSQITSHVSQGFQSVSQVIESGMGAPDPSELAQSQKKMEEKRASMDDRVKVESKSQASVNTSDDKNALSIDNQRSETSPSDPQTDDDMLGVFKIGKLMSNVTKLVETTGSAVVTGGLDTLEEIGKRTMRVLQGEEDGKKRLSTLLKETRERMDECPPGVSDEINAKRKPPQFEALFDDFQGLVHLEALEMLSKQCDMKIQSLLMSHEGQELTELKETLDQVKEICELPDPDEEDDKGDNTGELSPDVFRSKLLESIKDMGVQLQFDPIVECWTGIIADVSDEEEKLDKSDSGNFENKIEIEDAEDILHKAITSLAQSSALSVQLLHRSTALLSVRERRSTADEADGLTQLTVVLSSHIGEVAALYSQKLNKLSQESDNSGKINEFITTVFLEAGKGSSYIQDAFTLTIPILQIGAT